MPFTAQCKEAQDASCHDRGRALARVVLAPHPVKDCSVQSARRPPQLQQSWALPAKPILHVSLVGVRTPNCVLWPTDTQALHQARGTVVVFTELNTDTRRHCGTEEGKLCSCQDSTADGDRCAR